MGFAFTSCRRLLRALPVLALAALAAHGASAQGAKVSGTVRIEQVQIAFIGSGNLGGGTLTYRGKEYSFTIGGLGIGGFGFSKITATGGVYGLNRLEDFEGAYVQGRYGAVVGDQSTGALWLQNDAGVTLKLNAQREGLALSLGGDAAYIKFE